VAAVWTGLSLSLSGQQATGLLLLLLLLLLESSLVLPATQKDLPFISSEPRSWSGENRKSSADVKSENVFFFWSCPIKYLF